MRRRRTRSPSSRHISTPPPPDCSISSASSMPAAAGTPASSRAPPGCPGVSDSRAHRPRLAQDGSQGRSGGDNAAPPEPRPARVSGRRRHGRDPRAAGARGRCRAHAGARGGARGAVSAVPRGGRSRGNVGGRRCRGAADDGPAARGRAGRRRFARPVGARRRHARLRGNVSAPGVRCEPSRHASRRRWPAHGGRRCSRLASRTRSRPPPSRRLDTPRDAVLQRSRVATPRTLRRLRMTRRHLAFALAAVLVTLTALAAVTYGQSGEYKIGVLEPLTGPLAGEGKRHLEGFEIVRDMINERGGVMGKKLTFVVADAPDPTAAATEATRLATREGVKVITGTFSSRLCGAASEAAARQNVIYWETSCVDPRMTRRNLKNVFRTEIDGTGFGWYNVEFIAKHLAHRLGKKPSELKIAYLSEDSSYGQSVTESARQRARAEFGMQEVALEYYTFTTNDLTPVILKLKNANPDILHHIARNQDSIIFWRQAREQNFLVKAVVHAGATGYGSPDFGKAFGNDANGPFALLEPGPGLVIEKFRPEGQL